MREGGREGGHAETMSSRTLGRPSLPEGSLRRHAPITSATSGGVPSGGGGGGSLQMASERERKVFLDAYGWTPVRASRAMTPIDHTSDA